MSTVTQQTATATAFDEAAGPPVPQEVAKVADLEAQLESARQEAERLQQERDEQRELVDRARQARRTNAQADAALKKIEADLDKLYGKTAGLESELRAAQVAGGLRPPDWIYVAARDAYYRVTPRGALGPALGKTGYSKTIADLVERGVLAEAGDAITAVVEDVREVYSTSARIVEDDGARVFNGYTPPTLAPAAGDWSPIYEILRNLCGGNDEHVEYVCDWLAHVIQGQRAGRPVRMLTALNFYGTPKGAGKNVMGHVIGALMGPSNVGTFSQSELDAQFNGWARGRLFQIGNELFSSENRHKAATNRIKTLITDDERWINEKSVKPYTVRPWDNFWFFSNDLRPLVVERDDRRLACFRVLGAISPALGKLVKEDAQAGGPIVAALLAHLLERVPSRVQPGDRPLDTEARRELMALSGDSAETFAAEILEHGFHAVTAAWEERVRAEYRRGGSYDPDELARAQEYFIQQEDGRRVPRSTLMAIYSAWCSANSMRSCKSGVLYATLRDAVPGAAEKAVKFRGRTEKAFGGLPGVGEGTLAAVPRRKQGVHLAAV